MPPPRDASAPRLASEGRSTACSASDQTITYLRQKARGVRHIARAGMDGHVPRREALRQCHELASRMLELLREPEGDQR